MNRQPVSGSKKVAAWAYDPVAACLEIEYVWHSIVRYFHVPPELVAAFQAAPSKGRFLSQEIERHKEFPWAKLRPGEDQIPPVAAEFVPPDPDSVKDARIAEDERAASRAGEDEVRRPKPRVRLI